MNIKNHQPFFLFVFIITTLIVAFQVYWNYKMYITSTSQYIYQTEKAFDQAVDNYYFQIGKSDVITMLDLAREDEDDSEKIKNFLGKAMGVGLNSISFDKDSTKEPVARLSEIHLEKIDGIKVVKGKEALDQNKYPELRKNQITIRLNRDSLDFKLLKNITDSIFLAQNLKSDFNLFHIKKNNPFDSLITVPKNKDLLSYTSQSEYLEPNQDIKIEYDNVEKQVLINGLFPLLLSLGLSIAVLLSILKLIATIKKQKQLSDIKDDFISNITHEFKTPIATASAAIEALDKFNLTQDKEKTKKYLGISYQQLNKLDFMVEKLLEASILDQNNIKLNKKEINILPVIKRLMDKYEVISVNKKLNLICSFNKVILKIDEFYFISAITNLLDNAYKYGGDAIDIIIKVKKQKTIITVTDNGTSLSQADSSYIFDKFSRKSIGNIHTVKGNGIGLYFTKKIIEKHGGSLLLKIHDNKTAFIITV